MGEEQMDKFLGEYLAEGGSLISIDCLLFLDFPEVVQV